MSDNNNLTTLKECTYNAIAKHTGKILKYEPKVMQDKDPEDLHQMRVGMRRLRSAIAGFAVALDLPSTIKEKSIGKIARSLGKLRDLDVLLDVLENNYSSLLPTGEQKSLDKVLKSLSKLRKKEVEQVQETLKSKLYLDLRKDLKEWLKKPQYQVIGNLPIQSVLPDLLLPQISHLLLHEGWLVGIEFSEEEIQFIDYTNPETVENLLEDKEPVLHDLRKLAKKIRYNLDLFSPFYDENYQEQIKKIEQVQEVLGQIQDCSVLKATLDKILESDITKKMPELANLLTQTRWQKWQEWQDLQKHFFDKQNKKSLRQTIQDSIILLQEIGNDN